MSGKKLVLLGGGGFIGSNLTRYLVENTDYELVVVDLADDKLEGIDPDSFEFLKIDVTSDEALDACRDSDVIVDLVAYANPSLYLEKPLEVFDLNFVKNLEVLDIAVQNNKKLIQFSTCEVYGKPSGDAWSEDRSDLIMGPIHMQRWIYAASKQLLERVIYAHGVENGLDYSIIRPFNFIGPRFDYLVPAGSTGGPRVFAHYLSALLSNGPMMVVDGGSQHRTFTHIDDASRAFVTIIESDESNRQIFNVGNPNNDVTILDFAQRMKRIYSELTGHQSESLIIEISGEEFYGAGYEDVDRVPPIIEKLQKLGWEPQHDLDVALRDAIAAHLKDGAQAVPALT